MLRFLRKIRLTLLGSSGFRKYLFYSIGEILLVVIGILIALQINNWNQDRIDRNRSRAYHQRLIEDLDFIVTTNSEMHENAVRVMNSISETITLLERGSIENEEEQEVIDFAMIMFPRLSRQINYISTWEEMKSNGDINLVYNIQIRKSIDALQGFINLAHEVFSKHASAIRGDYNIYSKYTRTIVDSNTMVESVISDFNAMASDPHFINQFSTNISSWRSQAAFGENIAERADRLKEEIRVELESI